MKTTAKRATVLQAIDEINREHKYEIELNRDDHNGKWFNFTIKSKRSGIPGSRTSHSGRRLVSASWHAHGYLFDKILEIEPQAVIKSLNKTIDINGGNWEDMNIGSAYSPLMMSQTSIL